MGFPWRTLLQVGRGVGSVFIPGLEIAIQSVETAKDAFTGPSSGPQKKAAAVAAATGILAAIEGATEKDLLHDPLVKSATGEFVDAYVAAQNAIAAAEAARDALKQAFTDAKSAKIEGPPQKTS